MTSFRRLGILVASIIGASASGSLLLLPSTGHTEPRKVVKGDTLEGISKALLRRDGVEQPSIAQVSGMIETIMRNPDNEGLIQDGGNLILADSVLEVPGPGGRYDDWVGDLYRADEHPMTSAGYRSEWGTRWSLAGDDAALYIVDGLHGGRRPALLTPDEQFIVVVDEPDFNVRGWVEQQKTLGDGQYEAWTKGLRPQPAAPLGSGPDVHGSTSANPAWKPFNGVRHTVINVWSPTLVRPFAVGVGS